MDEATRQAAGDAAERDASPHEAAAAARGRQSHVRHELRGPLAVMYPTLSLLLDGGAGELTVEQREYLEVLDRSVIRLEALIDGIADSGWADCSAASPVPAEVSLDDVVEDVIAMRRIRARQGPSIETVPGDAGTPCAWADRDDVRQIVADLIENAVSFAPAAGHVTVRSGAAKDGATVTLVVTDDGPGVPPEELPRLFEFGFRGELAHRLRIPGMGAGLWICRQLARRNGGELEAESPSGAGLTITLSLPAVRSEA